MRDLRGGLQRLVSGFHFRVMVHSAGSRTLKYPKDVGKQLRKSCCVEEGQGLKIQIKEEPDEENSIQDGDL